jgi:hypothetical protein
MARIIPTRTYKTAIFHPNIENNITNEISLTIGEEIKNVKVIPNGIPASTNPINNGTVEQEQKGDITPNIAAKMLATPFFLPSNQIFTFSGGKKLLKKEIT